MPFETSYYRHRLHAVGVPTTKQIKVAYILKNSPCVSPPLMRLIQAGVTQKQIPAIFEIWREMHENVECVVVKPEFTIVGKQIDEP